MKQAVWFMFWDNVASVYDIFTNIINKKAHEGLRARVADEIFGKMFHILSA